MADSDPRFPPGRPPCWLDPSLTAEVLWNNCTSVSFDRPACHGCGRDSSQPRRLHPDAIAAMTNEV